MSKERSQASWEAKPWAATLIRVVIIGLPILASVLFGLYASAAIPPARLGVNRWIWWLGLVILATGVVRFVDLFIRRASPLAMLFQLSLVFPDQTPSRFKTALRAGTITSTKKRIQSIQREGVKLIGEDAVSAQMLDLIGLLAKHDKMTRGHSERVRGYSELIAEQMGIEGRDLDKLRWAALLHDMGKLDVPSEILNKPGRPSEDEWKILSQHPAESEKYLEPIAEWLGEWRHAADGHHEKWDGSGYPNGLKGLEIPLAARIVAVADAYDVMTSTRSYKKPLPAEVARKEVSDNAGTQFDPAVARAFLEIGLGDLRRVGGRAAWFASLPAFRQIPVGSVAQPVISGVAAVTTTVGAVVATGPEIAPPPPTSVPEAVAAPFEDNTAPMMDPQQFILAGVQFEGPTGQGVAAVDPEGAGLTYSIAEGDHPFEIDPATGELSLVRDYVPGPSGTSSYAIEVTVSDGELSTTRTHEVRVIGRAGLARPDLLSATIPERAPAGATVTTVFDPDAVDEGTVPELFDSSSLFALSNGAVVVADALDFETEPSHRVEVRWTEGGQDRVAFVDISVVDENEAPAGAGSTATVDEGGTIELDPSGLHADPEGGSVRLSFVVDPGSSGTATLVDGRLRYVHDGGESVRDRIAYQVVDDAGNAATGTIDITVTPVNDPPTMTAQSISVSEATGPGPTGRFLQAQDVDNAAELEFALVRTDGPFGLTSAGQVTVAQDAALDHESVASYTMTVTVTDGEFSLTEDHTIVISNANESPAGAAQTFEVSEGAAVSVELGTLQASDPDGDTLTWSLDAAADIPFAVGATSGAVTVAGPIDFEAVRSYEFTARAADAGGASISFLVTVNVVDVDEGPEDADFAVTVLEGGSVDIDVSGRHRDPEGRALGVDDIISGGTRGTSEVVSDLRLRYTHDGGESTTDTITYSVADPGGNAAIGVIAITVVPTNDAPIVANQTISVNENLGQGGTGMFVAASDPDHSASDLAFVSTTTGTPFSVSSVGELMVDPGVTVDHEAQATYQLTVVVSDGERDTEATVTVQVVDLDDAPVPQTSTVAVPENTPLGATTQQLSATDQDTVQADLVFDLLTTGLPFAIDADGTIEVTDPLRFDFESGLPNDLEFTYTVSDTTSTIEQVAVLSITDVNEDPSAGFVNPMTADEEGPAATILGSFTFSDPDGDTISASIAALGNPDLDNDTEPAFTAVVIDDRVEIRILDADDVDFGVAGQDSLLDVVLDDGNGGQVTVPVEVATESRFVRSPHFGEIIFTEVAWRSPTTSDTEFVELLNVAADEVDMTGWYLGDHEPGINELNPVETVIDRPLASGQRMTIWTRGQYPNHNNHGAHNIDLGLANTGLNENDDLWLFDAEGRLVAFMVWGDLTGEGVHDLPPIEAWSLWDASVSAELGSTASVDLDQSISLGLSTAAGAADSRCWEPTATGNAVPRCAGAVATAANNPDGYISSPARPN